jgi:hypothetical protein
MTPDAGRFVRQNAFLVAAVALPLLVVVFFLLAAAIPRWTVPPPAYDLVLRGTSYDQPAPRVSVEFEVRDGRVQATVRAVPATIYPSRATLFLFDHETMKVTRLAVDVPDVKEGDPPHTFVVPALEKRRVISATTAPDGYELKMRTGGGTGIVGDLFGMGRYDRGVSLVNRGRVVSLALPPPFEYYSPVYALGWVDNDGQR